MKILRNAEIEVIDWSKAKLEKIIMDAQQVITANGLCSLRNSVVRFLRATIYKEFVIMEHGVRIYFIEMRNTITMVLRTLAESEVTAS